ncbi:hypothetical protein M6B38_120630 [Iris pallida]|uniref:Secreted protein n=1 Tax=Iris pallida TaxID=29817 RepID=A0AAX6H8T0_IRIPA|nr:hypothetical protein M6B38_147275 [Iris pallida]KAJ6837396.1 hypothetical protein M6B38_120625 [Iris pallida]KAJ6837397.1 hypothetical protein M6B38_120630 [Iris pallida]
MLYYSHATKPRQHFSLLCLVLLVGVVRCSLPDRIRYRYLEDMVPPWARARRWWSCVSGWT